MSETFEGERICCIEPFDAESSTIEYREEIVRCRDCKHCRRDDSRWYCSELMFDIDWVTSDTAPDSFCAWACRKEQQSWGERK